MPREIRVQTPVAITNPNKAWVSSEVDKLIAEWSEWANFCTMLATEPDSPDYNPQTCSEAIKDGRENLQKHKILREKTLVFLRNHFSGSEFILDGWYDHPYESVTSRLSDRAPYWLHRLEVLKASMGYFQLPDGFWQGQGKKFLEALSDATAEGAIDVAKSWLRNPTN
ncbi:hypothetical protein [uncultured Tateyamaria sp.]|uniref:hypothetical protein n=1 Tax=uncultured Tateyamaria sp. TaxID=455651 RepID=UPI00262962F6|nr:hypothetical protein [uncultured Tateyamaria sp.]